MTSANLSQSSWRGRSDTGAVDAASPTWIAAAVTNWTQAAATNFRVRFLIQDTTSGTPTAGMTVKLQCNKNGGTFQDVTASSTIVKASATASSDADETIINTARLSGTGTYAAGHYSADGAGDTGVTIVASGNTEYEFGLQIVTANVKGGDTIGLKVVTVSGSTITATTSPSITVAAVTQTQTNTVTQGETVKAVKQVGHAVKAITAEAKVTFVNAGASTTSSSASSRTPALPANIVVGNLLLAWVVLNANDTIAVDANWTLLDSFNNGTLTAAWAWRIATGADAAPQFTWSVAGVTGAMVEQYTGTDPVNPIGAHTHNLGTGTTITAGSVTTTTPNACVIAILSDGVTNSPPPVPADFVSDSSGSDLSSTAFEWQVAHQYMGAKGTNSTAISVATGLSTNWKAFVLELIANSAGITLVKKVSKTVTAPSGETATLSPSHVRPISNTATQGETVSLVKQLATTLGIFSPSKNKLNPADKTANLKLSGGNLTATTTSAGLNGVRSQNSHTKGKFYFEVTLNSLGSNDGVVGIANASAVLNNFGNQGASGGGLCGNALGVYVTGGNGVSDTAYNGAFLGAAFNIGAVGGQSAGDVIGIALDMDNLQCWMRVNAGQWWGSGTNGNPTTNSNGVDISAIAGVSNPIFTILGFGATNQNFTVNFGATPFAQGVPTGFNSFGEIEAIVKLQNQVGKGLAPAQPELVTLIKQTTHAIATLSAETVITAARHLSLLALSTAQAQLAAVTRTIGRVIASFGTSHNKFNQQDKSADVNLSNGNLTATAPDSAFAGVRSTFPLKTLGKYYFEFLFTNPGAGGVGSGSGAGIATASSNLAGGAVAAGSFRCSLGVVNNGNIYYNGTDQAMNLGSFQVGDTICCAMDMDHLTGWFRRNGGNWNASGTADPSTNTGGVDISSVFGSSAAYLLGSFSSNTVNITMNTSAAFSFTAPAGFGAPDNILTTLQRQIGKGVASTQPELAALVRQIAHGISILSAEAVVASAQHFSTVVINALQVQSAALQKTVEHTIAPSQAQLASLARQTGHGANVLSAEQVTLVRTTTKLLPVVLAETVILTTKKAALTSIQVLQGSLVVLLTRFSHLTSASPTQGQTVILTRQAEHNIAASQAETVLVSAKAAKNAVINALQASNAALRRQVDKLTSLILGQSAALAKQIKKSIAVLQEQTVILSQKNAALARLVLSQAQTASVSKTVGSRDVVQQGQQITLLRVIAKTIQAAQNSLVVLTKQVGHSITSILSELVMLAAQKGTSTLTKALAVTQPQMVVVQRQTSKMIAVANDQLVSLVRVTGFAISSAQAQLTGLQNTTGKLMSATQAQAMSLVKSVHKLIQSVNDQLVVAKGTAPKFVLAVTQSQTVTMFPRIIKAIFIPLAQYIELGVGGVIQALTALMGIMARRAPLSGLFAFGAGLLGVRNSTSDLQGTSSTSSDLAGIEDKDANLSGEVD